MYCRVKNLLGKVRRKIPSNVFTGGGIVIYESLEHLPILLLNPMSKLETKVDLFSSISESCLSTNPYHDGFSLISKKFEITHQNVYLAPPINLSVKIDLNQGYGTRYVTALMSSQIKGVIMTAVISNSYGIIIFKDGKKFFDTK